MKLTQPSITFFLLSLASTAQATKVTRRGGSDYGGERRLKSKSTKAPSGGKGSKSQAPSLAPSSAPTRSVSIDTTCLVEGTTIEGSSTVIPGDLSIALGSGVCDGQLYVDGSFSTVLSGEALADGADAIEAAGFGTYPLVFGSGGSTAPWSVENIDGALNGQAYCATLSATAADKGTISEYNEDVNRSSNTLNSFSYDYYVDTCGELTAPCGNQFYLNVYLTGTTATGVFYSCKYDYVPDAANGVPGNWYTFSIDVASPSVVTEYPNVQGTPGSCPDDPNTAIASGDYIWGNGNCQNWVINIGDSEADDENLKGCIDNIRPTYSMAGSFTFDLQGQTI